MNNLVSLEWIILNKRSRTIEKRNYYEINKEKYRTYSKAYYQRNKEIISKKKKAKHNYKNTQIKEMPGFQMEFFQQG